MTNRSQGSEASPISIRRLGAQEKYSLTQALFLEQSGWSGWRIFPLFVLGLAALLGMAGCTGYTTKAGASGTATPIISVAITQTVPPNLTVGYAIPLSATVSNDPADAGVDWIATCGSAPLCGSFSPAHTASGGTTIFTAPTAVPAKSTVAITALSTTNHGAQFAAYVTVLSGVTAVIITQPPAASLPAGVTITLAATVLGDPANLGVDWKATCGTTGVQRQPVDCTPPAFHSPAGGTTTFIVPPPQQIPNIVGSTVTLTAFATADHSFSASALFQVTIAPTVSLTLLPPSTMLTNATATVAAVVANDTTNSGVTWTVSCTETPCGSLSKIQSASGEAITFTAPSIVPASDPAVVLTAYSTAAGFLVNATATVMIVAPLSVQITQGVPTGSIVQGASAPLVATVNNDPANSGVDWTVSCGSLGACGTFLPAHTASGAATTFTAPSAPPAGNSVTITATSTADPSQNVMETVTVTAGVPSNSLLLGRFVILLTSKNSSNGPYALGGVISGDGTGNITSGNVDVADASGNAASSALVPILSPSTYSIGPDGRGQIQLLLSTGSLSGFGVNGSGALTLSVVFVTPQHALLSESDSFGSGTGTLDLQNTADLASFQGGSWNNGTYSLEFSGSETAPPNLGYAVTSAVTINFPASAYAYITDQSDKGVITSVPFKAVSTGLSATRGLNGQLAFAPVNLGLPTQFNLDAWLIDATHFAVTDWRDSFSGSPRVIVAGYLTAQPTSPSISGTYAFTEAGATSAAQPQVAGGILTCGSSGILDVASLGGAAVSNLPIGAACTAPANGRGLITISGATASGIGQFAAYPTLDQGLYLIELDGGSAGTSGSSGTGSALPQTLPNPISASALSGKFASNFRASTALGAENIAGQIISDGVSNLSGAADVNSFNTTAAPPAGTPSSNAVLTGSFSAGTNGRFPLTLTITPATGQPTPEFTTLHSACYIVDASTCLLLGLDTTIPGTGMLRLQNIGF